MLEEWKDIKNFKGLYQVSNLGNVKSLDKEINNWKSGKCIRKGKILKMQIHKTGYGYLLLHKDGKIHHLFVHRLVAQEFIPNSNNYKEVNHIDGNKLNNKVSNLEWCDRSENMKHAYKNGLKRVPVEAIKKAKEIKLSILETAKSI